jgi:hypothetical protein
MVDSADPRQPASSLSQHALAEPAEPAAAGLAPEGGLPVRSRVDYAALRRTPVSPAGRRAAPGGRSAVSAEHAPVEGMLVRELTRVQLGLALRMAALVAVVLGGLPLLFMLAPAVTQVRVGGVLLPWLLLGVGSFPFLALTGFVYTRLAERNEADFIELWRDPRPPPA